MKNILHYVVAILLAGFGALTLFLSASIIFDLLDMRAREGNYVLFIVWANFISALLYLFASYGFLKSRKLTTVLLVMATSVLFVATIRLGIYINAGGLYETKTVYAMLFRTTLSFAFALISFFAITKRKPLNR